MDLINVSLVTLNNATLIMFTYEMSNVGYVNIIKTELFKVTSNTFIKPIY